MECGAAGQNSPVVPPKEHIPAILREIIERYHPEGFTGNSWSGLGRGSVCHCENCRRRFRKKTGHDIPRGMLGWDRLIPECMAMYCQSRR